MSKEINVGVNLSSSPSALNRMVDKAESYDSINQFYLFCLFRVKINVLFVFSIYLKNLSFVRLS